MNTHKGDLSSETQTSAFQERGWTLGVPRFFAVETVWAHAGLEAMGRLRPDLVREFNYARLLALCNLRHPEFRAQTELAADEAQALLGRDIADAVRQETRAARWARRRYLLRRMALPTAAYGRRYVPALPTVADASRRYEEHAQARGISFEPPPPKSD